VRTPCTPWVQGVRGIMAETAGGTNSRLHAVSPRPAERHFLHLGVVSPSRDPSAARGNVLARLIFIVVATVVAIGSAVFRAPDMAAR
jgi:hypothetical protein